MIELKLVEDGEISKACLEKLGISDPCALCFRAADGEETLGCAAFLLNGGQAVMLGVELSSGIEALLGDGLLRSVWNYCEIHGAQTVRFGESFPMERLEKLEFFSDFGHEEIDLKEFFLQRKKCKQTR